VVNDLRAIKYFGQLGRKSTNRSIMSSALFIKTGFFTILLLLLACSVRKEQAVAAAPPQEPSQPAVAPASPPPATEEVRIVPGEAPTPSELAMLMREMALFADSTGKRIMSGKPLLPFPEQFRKLTTATPTPGMVDHRNFDPYAMAWLHHLDQLYKVPQEEQTGVFNTLVQTCAACHGQMCPGPLVRIRKMVLPDK
jgi:hypothetical protein